jgi:hypothetical protein
MLGDPALLNPLLAGAGAVALFDICRRLLPESRGGQATALLLYFSSAQMLAAAMTPYSMTGHLAFNLVWLALFLRGDKLGHAGAILIGFVATGLHQVIFHPCSYCRSSRSCGCAESGGQRSSTSSLMR